MSRRVLAGRSDPRPGLIEGHVRADLPLVTHRAAVHSVSALGVGTRRPVRIREGGSTTPSLGAVIGPDLNYSRLHPPRDRTVAMLIRVIQPVDFVVDTSLPSRRDDVFAISSIIGRIRPLRFEKECTGIVNMAVEVPKPRLAEHHIRSAFLVPPDRFREVLRSIRLPNDSVLVPVEVRLIQP